MPLGKLSPELGHHCLILGVVPPPVGGGRPQRPVLTSPPEPTGLSARFWAGLVPTLLGTWRCLQPSAGQIHAPVLQGPARAV